jgi:N,N'-diacetyllegionaminate synthase
MNTSYIISEIGNNHNGNLEKAMKLIDVSKEANVNAVKFQSFRGIDIVSPKVKANEYKGWDVKNFEYWYQFLDSITLKLEDHQKVIDYTLQKGMDFITTPTSPFIVEYLEKLKGIKAYKIASMDLNNTPLLKAVANTGKDVIMSTGMGEIDEVNSAVEIFKNSNLSILHCVSDYPLDPSKAYLNNISVLRKQFPGFKVGFSDHSLGHELCIAARCLGAVIFEKHITLSRTDPNPAEHHFSMEPREFAVLVDWLRHMDSNLNTLNFSRTETEKENKLKYRRSYHYNADFRKGERMSLDKLSLVRPGDGIDNCDLPLFIGKILTRNVKAYDPCLISDIN